MICKARFLSPACIDSVLTYSMPRECSKSAKWEAITRSISLRLLVRQTISRVVNPLVIIRTYVSPDVADMVVTSILGTRNSQMTVGA